MAFDLSSLRRGPQAKPPRIVIYGEHGLGKSTFAAAAPSPVFIPTEDGLGAIDTTSFPLAKSYSDIRNAIATLLEEKHDFKTVVLDSLDWSESLIWSHVAEKHGKEGIEDFDYGKGYIHAADELRDLLEGFNTLRMKRGMCVILTAHSQVKRFDDPTSESYDRFQLKLHKHASAIVQEWADIVAFASFDVYVKGEDVGFGKKRGRALEAGSRVMHTTRAPAFDAKNRYGLPPKMPLSWGALQEQLSAALKAA